VETDTTQSVEVEVEAILIMLLAVLSINTIRALIMADFLVVHLVEHVACRHVAASREEDHVVEDHHGIRYPHLVQPSAAVEK